ncbi:TM2 domain-containing protein [Gaetbulibacter aquiaggeris]|uniref:TM2 domain-containing protein n=1 Tax=Gaetbulibacter aquiaggeris TaxID=1735373 RepID=A0ABW7MQZ1_9FLAO
MKIKFLLTLIVVVLAYSTSYASFPVKRTVQTNTNTELTTGNTEIVYTPITSSTAAKDLTVGIILWFFLGWAAGHRWYYQKPVLYNILFIVTAGGLGVWWVIDLVNMIQGNF